MLIAAVALSEAARSFDKLYDYRLSREDSLKAVPGMRVLIPFGRGNKMQSAWIIRIFEGDGEKLKEISQIVDEEPLLSSDMIKLAEWIRTRYFCTWGDAIRVMIPAGVNLRRQKVICQAKSLEPGGEEALNKSQKLLMDKLINNPKGVLEQELIEDEKGQKDLLFLQKNGFIEIREVFDQR
ncbi:MAG TPA: hypothetical protein DD738_07935, partial [Ruminiclostridium sp.]|nr:hypothetical protein [Ruminiclostridium sp.]